jgi:hypothetical protein
MHDHESLVAALEHFAENVNYGLVIEPGEKLAYIDDTFISFAKAYKAVRRFKFNCFKNRKHMNLLDKNLESKQHTAEYMAKHWKNDPYLKNLATALALKKFGI